MTEATAIKVEHPEFTSFSDHATQSVLISLRQCEEGIWVFFDRVGDTGNLVVNSTWWIESQFTAPFAILYNDIFKLSRFDFLAAGIVPGVSIDWTPFFVPIIK